MKRTALLIITLLSVLPFSANAQKGWVRMPDGPWTDPHAIAFATQTEGYVTQRTDHGTILFLTSDGGLSWKKENVLEGFRHDCGRGTDEVRHRVIGGATVDPQGYTFVGSEFNQRCRSPEEFNAWTTYYDIAKQAWSTITYAGRRIDSLTRTADGTLFAAGASNKTLVWYGQHLAKSILLRSLDGGKSWTDIGPKDTASYHQLLYPQFSQADTGLVVAHRPVFNVDYLWTTNGGKSWRIDPQPAYQSYFLDADKLPIYGGEAIWYRPDTLNGSEVTTDLGRSWEASQKIPQPVNFQFRANFFNDTAGYRLSLLSGQSVVEVTADGGSSWTAIGTLLEPATHVASPTERVAYAVGPNGLLYKTTDGGGRFASVAATQDKPTTLKAWSSVNSIIVENASDEIRILDLLGRVVREGKMLDGFAPGVYIVVSGGESVRVLVDPL